MQDMSKYSKLFLLIIMSALSAVTDTTGKAAETDRERYIRVLEEEMFSRHNTNWVRIHAADALNEQGRGDLVIKAFAPEADTTTPQYRIGVWRVLTMAAYNEEMKRDYTERVRKAMLDVEGPDRLHAVETMAKLGAANPSDRPALIEWLKDCDDSTAAFIRWELLLSSSGTERNTDEMRLAQLLSSADPIARLRSAFALSRLKKIAVSSSAHLEHCLQYEAADSPARPYMLSAAYLHAVEGSLEQGTLKAQMIEVLKHGKPNEQLEISSALGKRGTRDDLALFNKLLQSREPDARIGGAIGALMILKK
jgi:hypothetical protein